MADKDFIMFIMDVVSRSIVSVRNCQHSSGSDCSFCEYMDLLGDCNCDDVNWCREVQCTVAEKCDEACGTDEAPPKEEMPSVIQEPEIVPVTAAPVGNDSEQDCSFCENMHLIGDCNCDDVNWCRDVQCNVPEKCEEACPVE